MTGCLTVAIWCHYAALHRTRKPKGVAMSKARSLGGGGGEFMGRGWFCRFWRLGGSVGGFGAAGADSEKCVGRLEEVSP